MSEDVVKEFEDILKKIKNMEQEIKNRIDRGEIVKPDSGNLVKDTLEAVEKYVSHYKPNLKSHQEVSLLGLSEYSWKLDVVIEDAEIKDEVDRVKAIIECKQIKEGTGYGTYANAHVPRVYMRLADLRNWEKPLKFAIFSRRLDKGKSFSSRADALFKSIGVEIIDWNDNYEWLLRFILRI